MSVIDRIIAGARDLSFGGPLGTLLERIGRHLPHWPWRGEADGALDPRRRVAFTIAAIALGAKMAKADGTVTRDEVAAFGEVFQVPPGEEQHVRMVFDLARRSTAGFDSYARQVRRLFADHPAVLEDLLAGLFHIALADGIVCASEDSYLREVARLFGFDARAYARIRASFVGSQPSRDGDPGVDPHDVLGVPPDASADEIRTAYHRLVRENHPDVLVGRGLPPECVSLATARVARINAAHDRLLRQRFGMRAQPA